MINKFSLMKIIAFIVLLLLLVGFVFFRKDKYNPELKNNKKTEQQPVKKVKNVKDKKIIEKEKVKRIADNFASIYYSYIWGNFSNIESQYYLMTDEMKKKEKNQVEKMKNEIKNQPRKYFTVRAELTDSTFISYSETKAVLKIDLRINNFAGAIVQRDTMVWVDEKGNYYNGDAKNLIINTVDKKIKISLVKVDNKWKVDEIKEK